MQCILTQCMMYVCLCCLELEAWVQSWQVAKGRTKSKIHRISVFINHYTVLVVYKCNYSKPTLKTKNTFYWGKQQQSL